MFYYKAFIIGLIVVAASLMLYGVITVAEILAIKAHVLLGVSFGILIGSTIITAAGGLIEILIFGRYH